MTTETNPAKALPIRKQTGAWRKDVDVEREGGRGELVDQTSDSPLYSLCHHMRGKCAQ